jgi:hypothetical protein
VAVGDIAFGVLLSVGGFAAGGVAVGGMAVGALALGGLAVGGLSLGGLALGALSFGGAAFGWRAAQGGLAVARDFAEGGGAAAVHANDDLAASYFAAHPFFSISRWVARFSFVLLVLPLVAGLLMRRRTRRSD